MGACAIDSRDPLVVEYCLLSACIGLPGGSAVEDPPAKSGDSSLVAGSGRSPAEGNGNSLQYSCLGNSMDRGVWWAILHGSQKRHDLATIQLGNHSFSQHALGKQE